MPCIPLFETRDDGTVDRGFMCGRGAKIEPRDFCRFCGKPSQKLCDAPTGLGKTCDLPMCRGCAKPIGIELDLCPTHVILMKGKA